MPANDLTLLVTAALAAGDIALGYVGQPLDVRDKPGDAGPVTAADMAVNAALEQQLRQARPEYGWLSEESADDTNRQGTRCQFIIDPIDGTRAFIAGERSWAHSLAVAEAGVITAAVVYLPQLNKLYTAALGSGTRLNGRPIRVGSTHHPDGAQVLAARPSFDAQHWPGGLPQLQRNHRPSLAYRLSLVAEGRFDAMFTFRPSWEWDIAAGALILSEAGARVTTKRGAALRFNASHPQTDGVLAANPTLHAALLDRLI